MNQIIKGTCVDISSEGKGVVKYGNDVIFCDGLFIGEEALISLLYKRAGVYYGKVKQLLKISKDRIEPKCKICTSCGGCQYQQIAYYKQLEYKTKRVENAFKRIAGIDYQIPLCLGMDNPYFYRNKIQVPFQKDKKGNVIYGFYRENSHEIIKVKQCYIESPLSSKILWDIKLLLEKYHISTYNELTKKGVFRYVLIRTSKRLDALMVVLVTTSLYFKGLNLLVDSLLKKHPEITTLIINENNKKTNVVLGENNRIMFGEGFIKDDILGLDFEISPKSFFQVNPTQVEVLYQKALSLLDEKDQIILDAYSGVGTIGLIASKKAKKVISVEIVEQAHKNAIMNAKRNNINNIEFFMDDASNFIRKYQGDIDVVIMDPPRKGSDQIFLQTLIDKKIKKIIYISCDPETLARDVKYLSNDYTVNYVQPVDMFPQTSHVETVACLRLKER